MVFYFLPIARRSKIIFDKLLIGSQRIYYCGYYFFYCISNYRRSRSSGRREITRIALEPLRFVTAISGLNRLTSLSIFHFAATSLVLYDYVLSPTRRIGIHYDSPDPTRETQERKTRVWLPAIFTLERLWRFWEVTELYSSCLYI